MLKPCISKEQLVQLAVHVVKNPDLWPDPMPRSLFVARVKEYVGAELVANAVSRVAKIAGVKLAIAKKAKPRQQEFYRSIREKNEKTSAKCDQLEQHAEILRVIVDKVIHRVIALETKISELLS